MSSILPELQAYCAELETEYDLISENRKKRIYLFGVYLLGTYEKGITPELIAICTHNSRRSHMAQLWLAVGAAYFGLPGLKTWSGGTEATAFNPRAVAALKRAGFDIQCEDEEVDNPVYQISWQIDMEPYEAFSKIYHEAPNPQSGYGAILVCDSASKSCPVVFGADHRFNVNFDDPKAFDDTPQESEKYDERCRQIGRELFYVLNRVKVRLTQLGQL